MGVANRDIKLENTLIDRDDNRRKHILKITDFGYCKSDQESLPKSKVGTPGYTGMPSKEPKKTGPRLICLRLAKTSLGPLLFESQNICCIFSKAATDAWVLELNVSSRHP